MARGSAATLLLLVGAVAAQAQMGLGNWRIEQTDAGGSETCESWYQGPYGAVSEVVQLPHNPMPTAAVNQSDEVRTPVWRLERTVRTELTWTGIGPPPLEVRILERSRVLATGTGDSGLDLEASNSLESPLRVLDPGEVPYGFRQGVVSEGAQLKTLPVSADGHAELLSEVRGYASATGRREAASRIEWNVSVSVDDRNLVMSRTDGGPEVRTGDRIDTDTLRSWVGIDDLGFLYEPPGMNPLATQAGLTGAWHRTALVRPDLSLWFGPNVRTIFAGSIEQGPKAITPAFELSDLLYGDLMPMAAGTHDFHLTAEDLEDHAVSNLDYKMHLHYVHEDYKKVRDLPSTFKPVQLIWSGYLEGNDSYSVNISYVGKVSTRTEYVVGGEAVLGLGRWHIKSATISAQYKRERIWDLENGYSITVNVTASKGPGVYDLWFGTWQDVEEGTTDIYNRLAKEADDVQTVFSPVSSARLGHNTTFRPRGG